MTTLRRLNEKGLAEFAAFIAKARTGEDTTPPKYMLTDATMSLPVSPAIEVPQVRFRTKRDAAETLITLLKPLAGPALLSDTGLWAWMSLHWFDDICPVRNGKRKVNMAAHYIPEFNNHLRRYRGLLVAPYLVRQVRTQVSQGFLEREVR